MSKWPLGGGEMAARVREFDWAATTLGPSGAWSERLKLAVELVLAKDHPACVVAGRSHALIYNDACAAMIGDRHPEVLGQDACQAFAEVEFAEYTAAAQRGETVTLSKIRMPFLRHGVMEQGWFDISCIPVREEGGSVFAVLVSIDETTGRVLAEAVRDELDKRQAFLLELSDALRPLSDPVDIQMTACRVLGVHAGVDRVLYGQVLNEREVVVECNYVDGAPPIVGRLDAEAFGRATLAAYKRAEKVVFSDVGADPRFTAEERRNFAGVGVAANASIGLVKGGRWVAVLGMHSATPRQWTALELVLLEETAERTWAAVERARAEAALRESEEQQRLTIELVPALLWWADPAGRDITTNGQWKVYTGQQDAEIQDFGWLDAIHPDDLSATRAAFEHAFATGEPVERQQRIREAGGDYRWHLVRHVPVRDESGAITHWFGAAIDVQELHELQERQQVLVAELQHRTRNLMGVVRAMADKTVARSVDLADFRARFGVRMAALVRVQGLLSRLVEGERIAFDALVRSELQALEGDGDRISLEGPEGVPLRSSSVQTFALAIHELATNALKYGALAQPQGRLDITWRVERAEADGRPWLHVDWRESGVTMPPEGAAPSGGGSGRDLIERALPYQFGARTTYLMAQDGVRCTISLPVSDRQARKQTITPAASG